MRNRLSPSDSPRYPEFATFAMLVGVFASEIAASVSIAIFRQPILALAFVLMGFAAVWMWTSARRKRSDRLAVEQIERADRWRADRNYRDAWNLACSAARHASGSRLYNAALTVLVRVALEERRFDKARDVSSRTRPIRLIDPHLEATIERLDGRPDRAIEVLETARRRPTFHRECARLLVELHAEANDLDKAVEVALAYLGVIGPEDIRGMIGSLTAWGEFRHAAVLTKALSQRTGVVEDFPPPPRVRHPLGTER